MFLQIKPRMKSRLFCLALLGLAHAVNAKITLPSMFTDNMVLQQKTRAAIWGKATGKRVTVTTSWNNKRYEVAASAQGDWLVKVATPSYGGPYTITISDGEAVTLKNVLIGEVWICSGQSNMEMPLAGWGKVLNFEQEIAAADFPQIRLLQTLHVTSNLPKEDVPVSNGGWQPCTPQYVADFSAVAYFFAREIYQHKKIPIGLIHTSWGGTVAEAWTSAGTLEKMDDFKAAVEKVKQSDDQTARAGFVTAMQSWQQQVSAKDEGLSGNWQATSLDVSTWQHMQFPARWETDGLDDFDGIIWFRRKITVPEALAGKDMVADLGTIDDNDITYFNGEEIGRTDGHGQYRRYTIPARLVKAGENEITIRIFDTGGNGGMDKEPAPYLTQGNEKLPLTGDWQYKIGLDLKKMPARPEDPGGPNRASVLYNAMMHPFIRYAIRGAIWYQGESNAYRAQQYAHLFPAMIKDWRELWAQGDFPFYFVQLANWMKVEDRPVDAAWAELREAQLKTLSLPNTGMAVAIDIGDAVDIHPKNKQEVGKRLALNALAKTYHMKIECNGPVFVKQQIENDKIRLTFKSAFGMKTSDGGALKGFAIAGEDKKFYWADAVVEGNDIVVSSSQVAKPVAVRYAWANNPVCNLINGAGLPASPFRTDDWAFPKR